jgi:Na+-driven multidrug efflux pump
LVGFIVGYILLSENPNSFTFGVNGIFFAMALDEMFRGLANFVI